MKPEERVIKTLNHEEPDKVPYFESTFTNDAICKILGVKPMHGAPFFNLLQYVPLKKKVIKLMSSQRKIIYQGVLNLAKLYRKAGIDLGFTITALFPRIFVKKNEFIDEFGRHMRFQNYLDGTEIVSYVDGTLNSFEEYESWEQPDPNWKARLNGFLAGKDIQKKLNDEIYIIPTTTGLMEVSWEAFGMKTFSRILRKRPQAKKVFDDRGKFSMEIIKVLIENGAKTVLIFDDYGFKNGLMMRPQYYREYVLPWIKKICEYAHKHDSKIILHSDGDLTEILDDIILDCQVDALNPVEPTTANPEYSIFNLKKKYGDKVTLIGNVSPQMLSTGTIEEIKEYTKKLMLECAPGGGYILASGHSINPVVTPDRWNAMVNTRDKYGIYPIKK